jgi:hypothetical protein
LKEKNKHDLDEKSIEQCIGECTLKDFAHRKLTKSHLRAFVIVRECEDIYEAMEMKLPQTRGSIRTIEEGNNDCILMLAYQKRHLARKAKIIDRETPCTENNKNIPAPLVVPVEDEVPFVPSIGWLGQVSLSISSISRRRSTSGYNLEWFQTNMLSETLKLRLYKHLQSEHIPDSKGINHWVWKWQFQNIKRASAILKLTGLVLPDAYISTRNEKECLFRQNAVSIAEMVNENNGNDVGSYMYIFSPEGGVLQQWRRVGSAAVGLKKRGNEHVKNSLQKCDQNRDSIFYRTFPHKECERRKAAEFEGHFQDLEQRVGISYNKDNLQNVIDLFYWSESTEKFLEATKHKLTLTEKKHRMICYFFETMLQLCLDTTLNVSKSIGNELFLGVIN